ncbi:MAG: nitrophenyl compound nitroreductase subunit ArsF family protein [Chloroflexi bacterium]|nr:nitrophenyl compound nitroreductase subunit ArsF family protein [Chloroflexota bacterium]
MSISLKAKIYLSSFAILAVGLLCACANPAPPATPPSNESPGLSQTAPPANEPSGAPDIKTPPPNQSPSSPDRVDVVYFHRPQRCPTCLCFEERIRYVVNTYFQKELSNGKMTFGVYNIGDNKNADIVKKYGAVGSQLFINTVKDGTDYIRDIQDIWSWGCRSNKEGFDQKVKSIIEQSLKGEQ